MKARVVAAGLYVLCPKCGEPISHPATGSHLWALDEFQHYASATCRDCRLTVDVSLPKTVKT